MDMNTAYFTLLSRALAIHSIVLVPFCVFSAIRPPHLIEVEFPPPLGHSRDERRAVKVPRYPPCQSVAFLIAVYLCDVFFIYPFTREGTVKDDSFHFILRIIGTIGLVIHVLAAIGWSNIRPNWLAAERNYGLWYSKIWKAYYMSFIVTGVAIMIPLFYLGLWHLGATAFNLVPIIGRAMYQAYLPLNAFRKAKIEGNTE